MVFRHDGRVSWSRPQHHMFNLPLDSHMFGLPLDSHDFSTAAPTLSLNNFSLRDAIGSLGLPSTQGAKSPLEDLVGLLKFAVGVEHGLLIQYLYAAYACKNVVVSSVLRRISTEEMGHLLSVMNLLVALGENPNLSRYDANVDRTFDPFPFRLEPVSANVLAKYAACERPDDLNIDPEELPYLPEILSAASHSAGISPVRVGLLYAKIYWLLRASDDPLQNPQDEPWIGFPIEDVVRECPPNWHVHPFPVTDPTNIQGGHKPWQASSPNVLVGIATTRELALRAIADLTSQGEGFGNQPDAHFDKFVEAYLAVKADPDPTTLVPMNPWYKGSAGAQGHAADEITSEAGRLIALAADQVYELILLSIALFFSTSEDTDQPLRKVLGEAAMACMKACLSPLAAILVTIDRHKDAPDGRKAAPCFSLPVSGPADPSTLKARIRELLKQCTQTASDISNSAEIDPDVVKRVARVFKDLDKHKNKLEQKL